MTIPQELNIIGLSLDLIGVLMLFKFGLPADLNRGGRGHLMLLRVDETEKKKAKKYDILSYIALSFIIIGFVFQLSANLVKGSNQNLRSDNKIHCTNDK